MTWAQLGMLLIQFGPRAFDLAEKLVSNWTSQTPLTVEDIQAARKLGQRTSRDAVVEALLRAGIALDSAQGQAILALVPDAPATAAASVPAP